MTWKKIIKNERKSERKHMLGVLLVAFILIAFYFVISLKGKNVEIEEIQLFDVSEVNQPKVGLGGKAMFDVFIAQTPKEKLLGLSIFNQIKDYQGMLFYFPIKSYPNFWMKDMKFDIDMVWIKDNEIVDIDKNLSSKKADQLKMVLPIDEVNFVLEINAGLIDKFGIKIGDSVDYHNIIFVDNNSDDRLN